MRVRTVIVLVLIGVLVASAQAQETPRPRRRSGGRGGSHSSLLGLLRHEEVQKELKLKDEQIAKIKKIGEQFSAEMRKQSAELQKIEDREQRRAKYTELAAQYDQKSREQLGKVLAREQMIRLYQIRTQARSVLESLTNKYVVGKLKLTDEQKKKLAEIAKAMQAKRSKLFGSSRDANREQRAKAYEQYRKMRSDADKEALAVLTEEQRKAFTDMQGKKIELRTRRSPQRPAQPAKQ